MAVANYGWLTHRAQFTSCAASGRRWVSPTVNVQFKPNDAEDVVSFGVTVSKKVGNAVKRSRVKRQLRALIAELVPELACASGSYVLIARPAAWPASYAELKKDVRWALTRVQTVEPKPYRARKK